MAPNDRMLTAPHGCAAELEGVPMTMLSMTQRASLALLLGLLIGAAPLAAAEL